MMNRQMRRQAKRQQGKQQSQAQQPLAMLQKVQEELESLTVEGSAGGGVVKVVITGKQTVESVEIAPEAVEDPGDASGLDYGGRERWPEQVSGIG